MHDRKHLVSTFWLVPSLMLLASVLAAPVQIARAAAGLPETDRARRDPALVAGRPAVGITPAPRMAAAPDPKAVLLVDELPAEDEEQDRADARDEPGFWSQAPCAFHKIYSRRFLVRRLIPSHYPLRC